jgi:hypothetical protein
MYPDILLNSALRCFLARSTTECSCAVRTGKNLVDVVHQVGPFLAAPLENVAMVSALVPWQFLCIDQKHIRYIHLIHQLV